MTDHHADLYELVFEGLTEVTARIVIREIAGHPVELPAEHEVVIDVELSAVRLSSHHQLEAPHLRVLRYDGSTFDVELNFSVLGTTDPGFIDALQSSANRIATTAGASSYYAGLDPARDEETRLFTGAEVSPFTLGRSG